MAWNKLCFVPFCKVSGVKNPDKVFFCVPRNPVERLRWLNAVKRDPSSVSKNTRFYCCQDHFDVDKDVINFKSYKLHRGPFKVCFRYGAVPSKFDCFKNKRVRSVEELRKKRMVVTDETIKMFVDPTYTESEPTYPKEDGVNRPVSELSDEEAEAHSLDEYGNNDRGEEGFTTLHSLEEINNLLLDINNLGILGSVLNAYNNIYGEQKKWAIKFILDNAGVRFDLSIKKIGNRRESPEKQTFKNNQNSKSFSTNKGSSLCPEREELNEEFNSRRGLFADTQTQGDHLYSSSLLSRIDKENNPATKSSDSGTVTTLPKDQVAPVYQCDYCCYGSLFKYRLKHHITSKHRRRFTVFKKEDSICNTIDVGFDKEVGNNAEVLDNVLYNEFNLGKSTEDNVDSTGNAMGRRDTRCVPSESGRRSKFKRGKRKKLSYYMSYSKAHEIKRLERQVQSRRDWLEEFLKTFDQNKSKTISKNKNLRKTYSCVLCQFTSTDQTEVYKHTGLTHVYENGAYLECPNCEFRGAERAALSDHLNGAHIDDDYFKCKTCGVEAKSNDEYFKHVCEVHANGNVFRCSQCKYASFKHDLLQKHINFTHKRISKFECGEYGCNFEALSENQLNNHMMEMHQELRPFVCNEIECNFATTTSSLLAKHLDEVHAIETHPGDKVDDLNYEIGDEDLIETLGFDREETIENMGALKKLYKCGECTFTSSSKSTVDAHIREIHQGYYPFKCDICDFKTSVKRKFQMHYDAVHLKKKPYQCSHCNTRFAQRGHVVRHIQDIHLKEKPNLCSFCKYCTANRANLKAHLKAIHKIPDEDIKEVLKSCINLRKQESNESEFNKIIIYDTVDLLPDEDSQTSQIIQDLGIIME